MANKKALADLMYEYFLDPKGKGSPLTAFGDLKTAELTPIFQGSFEYTVDNTELTTNLVTNGGTVTQADAMAVVSTSTTTGSMACLQSKRHARYRAGLGGLLRFTTLFSDPAVGTEQLGGLVDVEGSNAAFKNGIMVGYVGEGFGFHRFTNDVRYSVAQEDWDDPLDGNGSSGYNLTDTRKKNLNIWFINYGYLGALAPQLWFVTNENRPVLVHTFDITGQLTTPHSYNPNYFFMLYANNGATTSDITLKGASYAYFTEGKVEFFEVHQPQISSGEQSKTDVTTEVPILTIRNKSTYAGKENFIDVQLEVASAFIEASATNNLASIRLVRDAILVGASYSDLNTTDSVVELDTSSTSFTGGKELLTSPLAGKNDRAMMNVVNLKIILAPNESITLAGSSAASADMGGGLLVKELF